MTMTGKGWTPGRPPNDSNRNAEDTVLVTGAVRVTTKMSSRDLRLGEIEIEKPSPALETRQVPPSVFDRVPHVCTCPW